MGAVSSVAWRRGRTYRPGQLVSFRGLLYQTVRATQIQPPNVPWYEVASAGEAFSPLDSYWLRLLGSSMLLTNGEVEPIRIGQPVYVSGNNTCRLAEVGIDEKTRVFGLVKSPRIDPTYRGEVAIHGVLEATTEQWDAVTTDSGGLIPGASYYLSTLPGGLTKTVPFVAGHFVVPVGIAQSSCEFLLQVRSSVRL
jgi:hypothetical protein